MSVYSAGTNVTDKFTHLCDLDGVKKKELERRKKLRLEQVRQQSKELSMKIRDRVAREKHRQIRNIEDIKAKELLSWKEQQMNSTATDYYYCLSNVGDAHTAAERDNEFVQKMDEKQQQNREIAAMRGRKALEKERLKNTNKIKRKPLKKVTYKSDQKVAACVPPSTHSNDEALRKDKLEIEGNESEEDDTVERSQPLIESSSRNPHLLPDRQKNSGINKKTTVHFSQVSDLIEERKRDRTDCEKNVDRNLDEIQENPSRSPNPILTPVVKSPKHKVPLVLNFRNETKSFFRKSPELSRKPIPRSILSFRSDKAKLKNQRANSFAPRNLVPDSKKENSPKKMSVSKVNTTRDTTTKILSKMSTTRDATPKILSQSKTQRREYVPRFTTEQVAKPSILKNKNCPVITTAAKNETPEKVQFYDHFNRHGKEYDAVPGLVQRESVPHSVNATEAAKAQNELDAIRFQQLEELRQKSQQRCKESLEKNKIRKDYELLINQLDELSKEENNLRKFTTPNEQFSEERLTQLASNRQQSMNRAFEKICHKPAVITCPLIGSNQNNGSSDINVATSPPPDIVQQQIDPFDSSDSCTSILLGYVDNRSRKLVKDIKQCKENNDGRKHDKLINLLARLDQLRKLLVEEIKQNGNISLEPFYRSVIEVETKKKKILYNDNAHKENDERKKQSEQLKKREQILKSKEGKLEKKVKELFLKEQINNQAVKPANDNTFESLTSATMSSSIVDQSEPVKIFIEVKNAAKIRKSRHPKKVQIVSNQDNHAKSEHKKSAGGSSASTAYRSPPPTIRTDLTKVLFKKTTANQFKGKTTSSTTQTKPPPLQTPNLADYITRLLGMSRPSIDQLGVSSSSTSIATPTESVIFVPENMSFPIIDENHLSRIQMEINEHHRFSKEVDDSLEQSNRAAIENIWKKMLEKKEVEANILKENHQQSKEKMKKQKEDPKKQQCDVITKFSPNLKKNEKTAQPAHSANINIQTEIPENAKQRIADLTKQIEQVRQDKQKMLEKTLSSAHSSNSSSGKGFDSTEYKDFPNSSPKLQSHPPAEEVSYQSSPISLPGNLDFEEPKNLVSTKQIGISFSRDSGIGSSRPVTSTDFRVSPDIKLTEKPVPAQPPIECRTEMDVRTDVPLVSVDSAKSVMSLSGTTRKSGKPPISLKRFSPQLDTEELQPHDLSTINEVETSGTSRINPSTRNDSSESSAPATYTKFPTFLEYAKKYHGITSTDDENNYNETNLKKMLDVTCPNTTDLNYRKLDEQNHKSDEKLNKNDNDEEYIDVEKEIIKRKLLEPGDLSLSSTNDSKVVASNVSDVLCKDFNRIGLNWVNTILKKTSTAQNLESSSSSSKSAPRIRSTSSGNSSDKVITGNPLNIREFLSRELLKRSQQSSSSSMSDNSTLTDQLMRSLLSTSTNSSAQHHATHRTSTPNRILSSESDKIALVDNNLPHAKDDINLFSGESYLSSVRGTSHSETSGAKETSE